MVCAKLLRLLSMAVLLLGFPATASAHLTMQGVDEIGSGALHPLVTPTHVLILLGLALLLGQRVPLNLKPPMLVFSTVSAIALALTATGWISGVHPSFLVGLALCIAALVALERRTSDEISAGLCAAAAIGIGLDSGIETGTPLAIAKTLSGTWITLNVVVGYVAICASNGADKPWARIGIRVLGSWIIAISLLVLAFSLRE